MSSDNAGYCGVVFRVWGNITHYIVFLGMPATFAKLQGPRGRALSEQHLIVFHPSTPIRFASTPFAFSSHGPILCLSYALFQAKIPHGSSFALTILPPNFSVTPIYTMSMYTILQSPDPATFQLLSFATSFDL